MIIIIIIQFICGKISASDSISQRSKLGANEDPLNPAAYRTLHAVLYVQNTFTLNNESSHRKLKICFT